MSTNGALIEVEHLKQYFPIRQGIVFMHEVANVHAVDDVTFTLIEGETLGLVGESGCGKTTVGRSIIRLLKPQAGQVLFEGTDILKLPNTAQVGLIPRARTAIGVSIDPWPLTSLPLTSRTARDAHRGPALGHDRYGGTVR